MTAVTLRHDREFPGLASPSDAVLEYEARRCHVCRARHPSFGFGPPLTRAGHVLWACGAHRAAVDSVLAGPPRACAATERQPALL